MFPAELSKQTSAPLVFDEDVRGAGQRGQLGTVQSDACPPEASAASQMRALSLGARAEGDPWKFVAFRANEKE